MPCFSPYVPVPQAPSRGNNLDHNLRPVTVGSVITRFGCRIRVRMNRLAVAETLLLSQQFSFGINGGVQQVILGITLALQLNPDFVNLDLVMRNAHTFSSRDKTEEELETNIIYNYLLEVFKALYGKIITPKGTTETARTALPRASTCPSTVFDRETLRQLSTSTSYRRGSTRSS